MRLTIMSNLLTSSQMAGLFFFAVLWSCESAPVPPSTNAVAAPANEPLERAHHLLRSGDLPQAAQLFDQIVRTNPQQVSAYEGLALTLLKSNQLPQAAATCSSGLAVDSSSVTLYNLLSAAYAGRGHHAMAIAALERAVALDSTFALGHANLGGLHTRLGQFTPAEEHLNKALALRPDDPIVRRRLGELLLLSNRPDTALQLLDSNVDNDSTSETLHYLVGKAAEAAGDPARALAAYDRARQLDPGFADAHYRTALLARRLDQAQLAGDALASYQRLQELGANDAMVLRELKNLRASILDSPEEPLHHVRLAQFFSRYGYEAEALNRFERVLQLDPNAYRTANQIGAIYLNRRQPDRARDYFTRALRIQPDFAPALVNAGNASMLLDDPQAAARAYARALDLAPQAALLWLQLARAQRALGQSQNAVHSLRQGLTRSGTSPDVRRAMEDLLRELDPAYQ